MLCTFHTEIQLLLWEAFLLNFSLGELALGLLLLEQVDVGFVFYIVFSYVSVDEFKRWFYSFIIPLSSLQFINLLIIQILNEL